MSRVPAASRRRAEIAGRLAETLSAWLYRLRGYRVLERRLRTPVGEIDLVVVRGAAVAFVEVKLRRDVATGLEALSPRARQRIGRAAGWWLARNPCYGGYTLRFDVMVWARWSLPRQVEAAFEVESGGIGRWR